MPVRPEAPQARKRRVPGRLYRSDLRFRSWQRSVRPDGAEPGAGASGSRKGAGRRCQPAHGPVSRPLRRAGSSGGVVRKWRSPAPGTVEPGPGAPEDRDIAAGCGALCRCLGAPVPGTEARQPSLGGRRCAVPTPRRVISERHSGLSGRRMCPAFLRGTTGPSGSGAGMAGRARLERTDPGKRA